MPDKYRLTHELARDFLTVSLPHLMYESHLNLGRICGYSMTRHKVLNYDGELIPSCCSAGFSFFYPIKDSSDFISLLLAIPVLKDGYVMTLGDSVDSFTTGYYHLDASNMLNIEKQSSPSPDSSRAIPKILGGIRWDECKDKLVTAAYLDQRFKDVPPEAMDALKMIIDGLSGNKYLKDLEHAQYCVIRPLARVHDKFVDWSPPDGVDKEKIWGGTIGGLTLVVDENYDDWHVDSNIQKYLEGLKELMKSYISNDSDSDNEGEGRLPDDNDWEEVEYDEEISEHESDSDCFNSPDDANDSDYEPPDVERSSLSRQMTPEQKKKKKDRNKESMQKLNTYLAKRKSAKANGASAVRKSGGA